MKIFRKNFPNRLRLINTRFKTQYLDINQLSQIQFLEKNDPYLKGILSIFFCNNLKKYKVSQLRNPNRFKKYKFLTQDFVKKNRKNIIFLQNKTLMNLIKQKELKKYNFLKYLGFFGNFSLFFFLFKFKLYPLAALLAILETISFSSFQDRFNQKYFGIEQKNQIEKIYLSQDLKNTFFLFYGKKYNNIAFYGMPIERLNVNVEFFKNDEDLGIELNFLDGEHEFQAIIDQKLKPDIERKGIRILSNAEVFMFKKWVQFEFNQNL